MEDIYQYLKWDHDHVTKLFKQFDNAKTKDRQKQIAGMIAHQLLAHAKAEQQTFYKALEKYATSKEDALHGLKEHREIEEQMDKIVQSDDFGSSWVKKVEKLKEIVEHHVKEEEHELFSKAKKVLSEDDAYDIKEIIHNLKQQLLRRDKIKIDGQ